MGRRSGGGRRRIDDDAAELISIFDIAWIG
jgi:hypothetical protein